MGVVGTVVCLFFWGAVSGSGPASVAAIGPMLIRAMEEDGYSRAFAAGLVSTGAAFSIVIPPSIGLVIFGVIAETSISDLFIAAIIPGAFMGLTMLAVLPLAGRGQGKGEAALDRLGPSYAGARLAGAAPGAVFATVSGAAAPVVILGGIYSGIFTPTEAALVATVYALGVGGIVYRTLTLRGLYASLSDAASSSAVVMMVVAYASLFGWVVTVEDLVGSYSTALLSLSDNGAVILIVIMLILLIAGMFMDAVTVMFISLPIFMPVVRELGWDPGDGSVRPPWIWPAGAGHAADRDRHRRIAANVTRLRIEQVARGALPFLLASLIGLVKLIAAAPEMSRSSFVCWRLKCPTPSLPAPRAASRARHRQAVSGRGPTRRHDRPRRRGAGRGRRGAGECAARHLRRLGRVAGRGDGGAGHWRSWKGGCAGQQCRVVADLTSG